MAGALWIAAAGCARHDERPLPPARESPAAIRPPTATPTPLVVTAAAAQDYAAEARLLYRVAACVGDDPLPPGLDEATVREHCAALRPRMEAYRERYLARARPFLASLRNRDLPPTVVYPFGGGDLLSALTTYPDALDVETLSLELAGDPRRIAGLGQEELGRSLRLIRQTIAPLLTQSDSTSANLMKGQRGEIPGQLAFFLIALAIHGYEPVSLRYFRIEPDGSLHDLGAQEIATVEARTAAHLKVEWTPPDFSPAFANMELIFRTRGADGPLRIHRHIGANLADRPLAENPGLLKHLESKGRVVAMTKAASYLLWRPGFSSVRRYLLTHMDFMISDSTGIPPDAAREAGFVQETYGQFRGSFLNASRAINQEFRTLWSSQPRRRLPFRYGYLDSGRHFHLLVTRRRTS